jgi:SAM-dependent methyltransferase
MTYTKKMHKKLKRYIESSFLYRFVPLKLKWNMELGDEIEFWDRWMQTRGLQWPDGYTARVDPEYELQPEIRRWIDPPNERPIEILDVAAGPMTWVGKRWESYRINITAVDVLARSYDELLRKNGIEPLVRTRYATIEELTRYVPSNHYDLVYIKNALDHSKDPVKGIREMLKAARPGCSVVLRHHRNESQRQGGGHLHNWNFDLDSDNRFVIQPSSGQAIIVEELLSDLGEFSSEFVDGNSPYGDISTRIRKLE